jgi:hypothetical protein
VPFAFDPGLSAELPDALKPIEDRRNDPVRGRPTQFRLPQGNMMAYTFGDFVPGWAAGGINRLPFPQLLGRPIENALAYGKQQFGQAFEVSSNQIAKVAGDIFQEVEAAALHNLACAWNQFMATGVWAPPTSYKKPSVAPAVNRQIAVVSLPRRYDWVRLLNKSAFGAIQGVRDDLAEHGLLLPTSTPDLIVVVLPDDCQEDSQFTTPCPNLGHAEQRRMRDLYKLLEGRVDAGEIILAIALKKSLRSDRLYQPLYEANIMQLLLEGELGAPQVDFEVHTLESAGTRAEDTYRAASLAAVARRGDAEPPQPHRAVRDLYEPLHAEDLVKRFLDFLTLRLIQVPPVPTV